MVADNKKEQAKSVCVLISFCCLVRIKSDDQSERVTWRTRTCSLPRKLKGRPLVCYCYYSPLFVCHRLIRVRELMQKYAAAAAVADGDDELDKSAS